MIPLPKWSGLILFRSISRYLESNLDHVIVQIVDCTLRKPCSDYFQAYLLSSSFWR
jgi:hypothetical protein